MAQNCSFLLNEELCMTIADWYDQAPFRCIDPAAIKGYRALKEESARQYEALLEAGLKIEPWLRRGQPYKSASELAREVRRSGVLYVYLTRNGHGRSGSEIDLREQDLLAAEPQTPHPMTELTGIRVRNVDIMYNDLFRAVHDFFGHIMRGCSFTPVGEFQASWYHLRMYSEESHPVLLSETVGQICWFFYGMHVRGPNGKILQPQDSGYIPPSKRLYSLQKTPPLPDKFVSAFHSLFRHAA